MNIRSRVIQGVKNPYTGLIRIICSAVAGHGCWWNG